MPAVEPIIRNLPRGSRVLDLGCGNGSFLARFREHGWELHGSDFSASGIEIATKHFEGIHFFMADAVRDPAEHYLSQCGGQVDTLLCTEVIEHVYSPRTFARLCYDLVRPGGMVVLSTPYHGYAKNLALAVTGRLDRHFTVLWDHGHIKFWSKKTLTSLLRETGFDIIEFRGAGRVPYFWKSMVAVARKPEQQLQSATV